MGYRKLAALLAALCLLVGCTADTPPVQSTEPAPEITAPETPLPQIPDEVPEEETKEPESTVTPEETPEPEPLPPAGQITDYVQEEFIEELVSLRAVMPQVELENEGAAQIINEYYLTQADKLSDYAWGEVYEKTLADRNPRHVESTYTIMRNQEDMISIFRTVTTTTLDGETESSYAAETFHTKTGGLFVAEDFFTCPEAEFSALLQERAAAAIAADENLQALAGTGWEQAVRAAFDKTLFYLTQDSYVSFYPAGALGELEPACFANAFAELGSEFRMPQV